MVVVEDVDEFIAQFRLAQGEFLKGNPEPVKKLFSHTEDVSHASPYGPPVRGWDEVAKVIDHSSSLRSDGELVGSEIVAKYVTPKLTYIVQIERIEAKVGAREDIAPFALRTTMIFRPEQGVWKVVHRHADPITTAQPPESVIQS
jgi:ketosteroid isomerase-like protein